MVINLKIIRNEYKLALKEFLSQKPYSDKKCFKNNISHTPCCHSVLIKACPSSFIFSQQQVVELSGYVIILVENVEGKIKLYGSPPDRDNLEVGDEILEVNGLTLDNISRTEVIRHIHDVSKILLKR